MKDIIRRFRTHNLAFNKGATPQELHSLQATLGYPLPAELLLLYQDHNGVTEESPDFPFRLMPINEVIQLHDPIRSAAQEWGWLEYGNRVFWTDDSGNGAGLYLGGLLVDHVCFTNHEVTDLSPVYRSLRSFLETMLDNSSPGIDWSEMPTDYPGCAPFKDSDASKADWDVAQSLQTEFQSAEDEGDRGYYAFCIMALTPFEHTESLLSFIWDEDQWVQERCCEILGCRKYKPAIPQLAEVATQGSHNGRLAAIKALGRIGTGPCLEHLLRLVKLLPEGWGPELAGALQKCGCEVTHTKGNWCYRLPGSDQWQPLS